MAIINRPETEIQDRLDHNADVKVTEYSNHHMYMHRKYKANRLIKMASFGMSFEECREAFF